MRSRRHRRDGPPRRRPTSSRPMPWLVLGLLFLVALVIGLGRLLPSLGS